MYVRGYLQGSENGRVVTIEWFGGRFDLGPIWLGDELTGADLTWGRFGLGPIWPATIIFYEPCLKINWQFIIGLAGQHAVLLICLIVGVIFDLSHDDIRLFMFIDDRKRGVKCL